MSPAEAGSDDQGIRGFSARLKSGPDTKLASPKLCTNRQLTTDH